MIAENSPWHYYLKGLHQVLQFRFLFIKNVNLKQKIKSKNISASDYRGLDKTLRIKKWGLKTNVVLAMLVTSFIFAASFSQGTEVASQTLMPTPTPTPALTLNQTIEPVATPELTPSYSNFTNFAYSAIGKYCSNNPIAKTYYPM